MYAYKQYGIVNNRMVELTKCIGENRYLCTDYNNKSNPCYNLFDFKYIWTE